MKRVLYGLATSAAIASFAAGAFAAAGQDNGDSGGPKDTTIKMAQASGSTGTGSGTGQLNNPDEPIFGGRTTPGSSADDPSPDTTSSIDATGGSSLGKGTPENPHDRTGTSSGDQTGNQIK